jgi:hypothetical protein
MVVRVFQRADLGNAKCAPHERSATRAKEAYDRSTGPGGNPTTGQSCGSTPWGGFPPCVMGGTPPSPNANHRPGPLVVAPRRR